MPLRVSICTYPNNEVRSRLAPPPTIRRKNQDADRQQQEVETLDCASSQELSQALLLDISSDSVTRNDSDLRPGFGLPCRPTQFGVYARRKLQRIGGVIDKLVQDTKEGLFLTGTLPGSTDASFKVIADWSAWIVFTLKGWIHKRVKNPRYFYVWELQRRGALHLHLYLHVANDAIRASILRDFKSQWIRLLDGVSVRAGVDVYRRSNGNSWKDFPDTVQAYAQEVEKSVAAYLSKYCSKQSSKQSPKHSHIHYPSRWWGCSRELTKELDRMTTKITIDYASHTVARSEYEEIIATLQRHSIKGYRYGDKVGLGLNHVFYYVPQDSNLVKDEVMAKFKPLSMLDLTGDTQALNELRAVCSVLPKDVKMEVYINANLSQNASKAKANVMEGFRVSGFEAYALSSEIHSLVYVSTANRGYTTVLQKRILSSCSKVAEHFKNLVLVEPDC